MARGSGAARLLLAGAALLLLAAASGAAAQGQFGELAFASTIGVSTDAEAAVATQMIKAFVSVSKEIKTGREDSVVFAAAPPNVTGVNAAAIQAKVGAAPGAAASWCKLGLCYAPARLSRSLKPDTPVPRLLPSPQVFASALATWQLGVIDAPTNKGLKPKKFNFYDLEHYYQASRRCEACKLHSSRPER